MHEDKKNNNFLQLDLFLWQYAPRIQNEGKALLLVAICQCLPAMQICPTVNSSRDGQWRIEGSPRLNSVNVNGNVSESKRECYKDKYVTFVDVRPEANCQER
jgi:hypothetical protein